MVGREVLNNNKQKPSRQVRREKNHFRKRKATWLTRAQRLSGFFQLLLSFTPSSFGSTLNTFGLPWESVCVTCHPGHCSCNSMCRKAKSCIVFVAVNQPAHHTKLFFFKRKNTNKQASSLNHSRVFNLHSYWKSSLQS